MLGGVIVNDVVMYVLVEDLFFGGVGLSGMGCYYGYDGFKIFFNSKVVFI